MSDIVFEHGFVYRDGKEYFLTMKELKTVKTKPFHFWPYELKRLLPQIHSCARCLNRPVDFSCSKKRMCMAPPWVWKDNVTDQEVFDAQVQDEQVGIRANVDALKVFRKCHNFSWSRAAPFYSNINCKSGKW